jgi:hypothetical protein
MIVVYTINSNLVLFNYEDIFKNVFFEIVLSFKENVRFHNCCYITVFLIKVYGVPLNTGYEIYYLECYNFLFNRALNSCIMHYLTRLLQDLWTFRLGVVNICKHVFVKKHCFTYIHYTQ